jgi:hypothetical protein
VIEDHVIDVGFDHFDNETASEYTQLGFAFDALRVRRIPLAHVLASSVLTRDERMTIESIMENVLKRNLVSLGKSESAIETIKSYLSEKKGAVVSSPSDKK